jgi:predicted permease
VIATLALGIGANTAIFRVTNAVLLRRLPVHDADQLVSLRVNPSQPDKAGNTGDSQTSFSYLVFERLRTRRDAFSDLIAHVPLGFNKISVRHQAEPEEAEASMVSGNLFSGLGVRTECGRPLTMDDEKEHAPVAVLGYAFFERSFASRCDASVGRTLFVKGIPFTIVGIAQRDFEGLEGVPTDVWVPLQVRPDFNAWGSGMSTGMYFSTPNWWCMLLTARLAPGLSARQAQALANPAFQHAAYEALGGSPQPGEKTRNLVLAPLRGIAGRQDVEQPLRVLMGMVGLILVIACGNIAMLLMARNTSRQREFSVRLAIGGTRLRLFCELLAESFLLCAAGSALGWALAAPAARALGVWAGIDADFRPDASVLPFAAGVSTMAGLIFGVTPLFGAMRVSIGLALKSSAANLSQSHGKLRTGKTIVALQVALCLMLVAASGLLVRTLYNVEHIALGMRTPGLLVFGINPQQVAHTDGEVAQLYQALLERLRTTPGIQSASLMQNRLGSGWSNNTIAMVDGQPAAGWSFNDSSHMRWNVIGPDLFATLGAIRRTVAGYSADLALLQPMTQQAQFDTTISDERLVARLSICFGALALLLVVTGLYGTLAYNVSRRTSEIGIRIALGARRLDVLWMVLRESLVVYLVGLAVGLPLTIASARLLRSQLFGLAPSDPLTLSLAVAGILVVGLAASLLPARRAASVEPTRALRYE